MKTKTKWELGMYINIIDLTSIIRGRVKSSVTGSAAAPAYPHEMPPSIGYVEMNRVTANAANRN